MLSLKKWDGDGLDHSFPTVRYTDKRFKQVKN